MTTKWLLTVPSGGDLDQLAAELSPLGAILEDQPPIPLDNDEMTVLVEGPPDLPARLYAANTSVIKIYPNSDLDLT